MPNIGGKIWFTAIAGLLLGFVLFGMIQRGCDAQGQATLSTNDQSDPQSLDFNAASRNNARIIEPSPRSNSNANSAKARRDKARTSAKNRRIGKTTRRPTTASRNRSALERNARSMSRADSARKAELARLTRERTAQYRERSRRARAGDPNTLDPVLRTRTTGSTAEDHVALAAAEAGAALRGLRGEGGSGSGSGGSGSGDVGGAGADGRGGFGEDGFGEPGEGGPGDEFAEIAALLGGLGIGQSFIDLIQQVVTGNTPPFNPFIDNNDDNNNVDVPTEPEDPDPETVREAFGQPCWRAATTWEVFEEEGRFLGTAELPEGVQISPNPHITEDHFLASFMDELGTIMVKRFRIVLPAN